MTCKDCIHRELCADYVSSLAKVQNADVKYISQWLDEIEGKKNQTDNECEHFADRSRFVELPDVGDYDTVTTIDEAIDHCYQIATSADENVCAECKAEHMRLCGWLGDLKRRIAAEQALKEHESNE